MRINWDYVVGLAMGIAVTKVTQKVIEDAKVKGEMAAEKRFEELMKDAGVAVK